MSIFNFHCPNSLALCCHIFPFARKGEEFDHFLVDFENRFSLNHCLGCYPSAFGLGSWYTDWHYIVLFYRLGRSNSVLGISLPLHCYLSPSNGWYDAQCLGVWGLGLYLIRDWSLAYVTQILDEECLFWSAFAFQSPYKLSANWSQDVSPVYILRKLSRVDLRTELCLYMRHWQMPLRYDLYWRSIKWSIYSEGKILYCEGPLSQSSMEAHPLNQKSCHEPLKLTGA